MHKIQKLLDILSICFLKACGGGTSNFDTEISLGAYAIPEIISASSSIFFSINTL